MIREVKLRHSKWSELPWKFEAGTPAIAEAVGLGVAVDYLSALGMDRVYAAEHELVTYAMEQMQDIEGLRMLGPTDGRTGLISFVLGNVHPHDIAAALDSLGIAVRGGPSLRAAAARAFRRPGHSPRELLHVQYPGGSRCLRRRPAQSCRVFQLLNEPPRTTRIHAFDALISGTKAAVRRIRQIRAIRGKRGCQHGLIRRRNPGSLQAPPAFRPPGRADARLSRPQPAVRRRDHARAQDRGRQGGGHRLHRARLRDQPGRCIDDVGGDRRQVARGAAGCTTRRASSTCSASRSARCASSARCCRSRR